MNFFSLFLKGLGMERDGELVKNKMNMNGNEGIMHNFTICYFCFSINNIAIMQSYIYNVKPL